MCIELLEAKAVFHNKLCSFFSNISVVPRLVPPCQEHFLGRKSLDKTVFRAVLIQKLIKLRICFCYSAVIFAFLENIDSKSELVLACS